MPTEAQKRNAIARLFDGTSKYETEAQRLGVNVRTLKRWVSSARALAPKTKAAPKDAPEDAPPPDDTPTEEGQETPVLERLLEDEGGAPQARKGPPTAGELQKSLAEMETFCVQTYGGLRAAVGSVLVSARYTPPLDAMSPEVLGCFRVGQAADLAIRMNAPKIYPILVKFSSNWGALLAAIAMDAFGLIIGLEGLAKSKGWTAPPKKSGDRAEVPSQERYAQDLRPKPAPAPAAAPAPVVADKPGKETVVNAPLPDPVDVEKVEELKRLLR